MGFRRAMRDAGIPVDPALVRVGSYRREGAERPAIELLTRPERPTAIFAANDLSALGVMDVAARAGIRVPDDLSVVGFDDVPEAALASPPLTTVRQPIQGMGAAAIELLVDLMAGKEVGGVHVRLPTELVMRGTTTRR